MGGGNGSQGSANRGGDALPGACPHPTQVLLGLGKRLLDRVEVGRIGRQEDQLASCRLNKRSGFGALMHAEVVEDHDLTWPERWGEHPFYERLKDEAIDSSPHQQTL